MFPFLLREGEFEQAHILQCTLYWPFSIPLHGTGISMEGTEHLEMPKKFFVLHWVFSISNIGRTTYILASLTIGSFSLEPA